MDRLRGPFILSLILLFSSTLLTRASPQGDILSGGCINNDDCLIKGKSCKQGRCQLCLPLDLRPLLGVCVCLLCNGDGLISGLLGGGGGSGGLLGGLLGGGGNGGGLLGILFGGGGANSGRGQEKQQQSMPMNGQQSSQAGQDQQQQ